MVAELEIKVHVDWKRTLEFNIRNEFSVLANPHDTGKSDQFNSVIYFFEKLISPNGLISE